MEPVCRRQDRPSIGTTSTTADSDTEGGFNFIVGAKQTRAGLFFEVKVGVEGSPDLKFGVGYTFR